MLTKVRFATAPDSVDVNASDGSDTSVSTADTVNDTVEPDDHVTLDALVKTGVVGIVTVTVWVVATCCELSASNVSE